MEQIPINNVPQGMSEAMIIALSIGLFCRDTALNLAAHRQKYPIVDLLIQYKANPNLYNQAGKTALHRAVVSYTNENAYRIRTLLDVCGFS